MMNPLKSGRVRAVVIAGAALAAVGATGLVFANNSSAAESRWVTATASTGDVTQTFTATGSVTRKNTATATFAADGTVQSVRVDIGDQVTAGQVLATLDARALKLALLQAETTVAQAELNLYNAQHPASASSARKVTSTKVSPTRSTGSKSSGTTPGLTTVTFDLTALNKAVSAVNLAVVSEAKVCGPIMAWVNEEVTGTDTTTGGDSSGGSDSTKPPASASDSPSASPSPSPSAEESEAESADQGSTDPGSTASPAATATQYATAADPTESELKACATARAELNTANATLQTLMAQINAAAAPGSGGGSSSAPSGGSSPGGSSSGGSGSGSGSVSKSQVASARANLLQANQKLQAAKDNLADAQLLAPISGTVGTVTLTAGESAGSGSITIVGHGSAVVTIQVPLKTRGSLTIGQAVQVTPAGGTNALDGTITNISLVETSGTAGDSPTYTTTVGVSDPDQLLASGARAAVTIPVKSVTGVVIVPASAVTITGTGTATVRVLASGSDTPTTTTVQTGAVGGGRVEITEGLTAGQVVVIADRTAEIPSNQVNRRTTTTTSRTSASGASSTAPAAATAPAGTQPGAQPTK